MEMITDSENETKNFGFEIAKKLKGGDILLLAGDLGAGKTVLAKGIAKGLGITAQITSPTFSLMNVYETKTGRLAHIDTYRLKNEKELVEIGAEDYLGKPDTICIVEWPEKIAGVLKNRKTILLRIAHKDLHRRKITVDL